MTKMFEEFNLTEITPFLMQLISDILLSQDLKPEDYDLVSKFINLPIHTPRMSPEFERCFVPSIALMNKITYELKFFSVSGLMSELEKKSTNKNYKDKAKVISFSKFKNEKEQQ